MTMAPSEPGATAEPTSLPLASFTTNPGPGGPCGPCTFHDTGVSLARHVGGLVMMSRTFPRWFAQP
jgi:hypothetical protein